MQKNVLIVESQPHLVHILSRLVEQADLTPLPAYSLAAAKSIYLDSLPETLLCALVGHRHADADNEEALDYFTSIALPTVAISAQMEQDIRTRVMRYDVVDYIGIENAQTADYLLRLILRLNKNKQIGAILQTTSNKTLFYTKALLQRHGFRTYVSENKEQTTALLESEKNIQLVMLDTGNQDTLAAYVAEIRKTKPLDELAIVGLASKPSDFLAAHFIKCGATDFFSLPFKQEEFLLKSMQILESIEHVAVIRQKANQDYLTGLPNRRHFFYSVNKFLPAKAQASVTLIDLDHFKNINDTYGHDAGDAVLKTAANLIADTFEDGVAARFGGEEFCIFTYGLASEHVLKGLEKLRDTLEKTKISFANESLYVTASMGVTFSESDNIEAMLALADSLLYKAKREGRNRIYSDFNLD